MTPVPESAPAKPSKGRLFLEGYVALIIAIALGTLASAPLIYSRVRSFTETTYIAPASPAADVELRAWALKWPGVVDFRTERRGEELFIRSEYRSSSQQPPFVEVVGQMKLLKFEFKGMRGGSTGMASGMVELLTDPQALALMLVGLQVAFAAVGIIGRRRAARKGMPITPLLSANHSRAIGAGVLGGLALLGLGLVYSKALESILGHAPPSPWDSAAAMPASTKAVFLVFGALGAPVAEEIFFRGYLFGKFKAAGHVDFGILVSSVMFGAVHFSDAYNVPATALYGVILAWLYHRSGSLIAPILAHAINNGVAIAFMIWG